MKNHLMTSGGAGAKLPIVDGVTSAESVVSESALRSTIGLKRRNQCANCRIGRLESSAVHYRSSHNHLLRDLRPALGEMSPDYGSGPFPGIIVIPTSSPLRDIPDGIQLALELAENVQATVVILCSGKARAADFPQHLIAAMNVNIVPIDMHLVDRAWLPRLPSFDHRLSNLHRRADQGLKRNLGLALAHHLGCEFLLFLDDDIMTDYLGQGEHEPFFTLNRAGFRRAWRALDESPEMAAIGWASNFQPDNSVVGHARRLVGWDQDIFIGGNALLVRTAQDDAVRVPSFPLIYNEDWLFLLSLMSRPQVNKIGFAGYVHQSPRRIFRAPRAWAEEPGDLIGEVSMSLFEDDGPGYISMAKDQHFWEHAIASRQHMIRALGKCLLGIEDQVFDLTRLERSYSPSAVLQASYQASRMFKADEIVSFVKKRQADQPAWNGFLGRVPELKLGGDLAPLQDISIVSSPPLRRVENGTSPLCPVPV